MSPMEPPRGVPVSSPLRLGDFPGFPRPRFCLSRQPTGSAAEPSRVGGASGPEGRLEPVQEVLPEA
jgi:hypothetical protein